MRRVELMLAACALLGLSAAACLTASAPKRSYFVLHQEPVDGDQARPEIPGLVRVRSLDAAKAYDKFQIVVRRSPYELRYSASNVWAVKPSRMIADIIGQKLDEANTFAAVTRELGESRPQFTIDGDISAIEIYDSDDLWFAHLAFSLRLTKFDDGTVMWAHHYDQRKEVPSREFSHAVRALSELLDGALGGALVELDRFRPEGKTTVTPVKTRSQPGLLRPTGTSTAPRRYDPKQPIYVPEPAPG